MNLVKKGYFVEVEEDPKTGQRLEERWMDEKGRLVEYVGHNYNPNEMTTSREKYDPETGEKHSTLSPASTETCLVSGVVFEEEYYDQGVLHRIDGDAYIRRVRHTGQDECRLRYLNGVEHEITPQGLFPKLD